MTQASKTRAMVIGRSFLVSTPNFQSPTSQSQASSGRLGVGSWMLGIDARLAFVRQREHVQRLSGCRHAHFGGEGRWDEARAAAAETGGHGDILLAVDRKRDRE